MGTLTYLRASRGAIRWCVYEAQIFPPVRAGWVGVALCGGVLSIGGSAHDCCHGDSPVGLIKWLIVGVFHPGIIYGHIGACDCALMELYGAPPLGLFVFFFKS